MSASQRRKGAEFERQVVNSLRELLGDVVPVRRAWERAQASGHDVDLPGFALECKRRASIAVYEWWEQACTQANGSGRIPAVVMRADRQPDTLVVLRLEDFVKLAREEIVRGG